MSRSYRESVDVSNYEHKNREDIIDAIEAIFEVEDIYGREGPPGTSITFSMEESLSGGESEDEWAAKAARAVIKANDNKPCTIQVQMTYMEELPTETYNFYQDEEKVAEIIEDIEFEIEQEKETDEPTKASS